MDLGVLVLSGVVERFVRQVTDTQARLVEDWLAVHVPHSAAPPTVEHLQGKQDMTVLCECGQRFRVWVEINSRTCTVYAEQGP